MGGKWLELLKQMAPGVTQAAVFRDPTLTSGTALSQAHGRGPWCDKRAEPEEFTQAVLTIVQ